MAPIRRSKSASRSALRQELASFIRFRWLAGAAILAGGLANGLWLGGHARWPALAAIGLLILAYNTALFLLMGRRRERRRALLPLAWVQLLLDLGCLTLLVMLTGGARSPAALFYVFHMVFASLLLPRTMAYGAAFAAVSMLVAGLWLEGTLERSLLLVAAHALTLGFSVFLANRIVQRLRRQNRRVRRIGRRLRRHQRAMVQHEKMFALGQLAANVTHEIANPLASMDSLLQLMQRRPERMSESALATLRQQIQRISEIIRQMKAFAHPHEMQRAVASPNEVVDEAVKIIRLEPRARRTTIETCLASEVGQISFMPQALQQVLVNLLINALDATADTPAPRITVRTGRKDDWVLIDVIDNGTGIAPQHLRRLFEPFFTTKPVGKGTGLGLSISYTLIERQGGSIGVRSTAGQGAQFTIRLPGSDLSRRRDVAAAAVAVSEKPAGG